MRINKKKGPVLSKVEGFTLIELLTVIAIIGILASIILFSMDKARSKTADSMIKTNLSHIITRAETLLGYSGCYSSIAGASSCASAEALAGLSASPCALGTSAIIFYDENIEYSINEAGNASNGVGIGRGTCAQAPKGGAWAVSVPLKSDETKSWCVDNKGTSKEITGSISSYVCP